MNLIQAGIARGRTSVMAFFLLVASGGVAYNDIPKESFPEISIPIIYVSLSLESISPEDSERLLVRPMEKQLRSVEGVKEMRSTAYFGGGNVVLEFDAGFDSDQALSDVRNQVELAKRDLPEDAKEPTVNEVNTSRFPVLTIHLAGNVEERYLLRRAEGLRDSIQALPSILNVNMQGNRDETVEIVIDTAKLESYGFDPASVLYLFARFNRLVAAGSLEQGGADFAVKLPGLIEDLEDILEIPLRADGERIVRVRDVTEIRPSFKDRERFSRLGGQSALSLEVVKRSGENIIDSIDDIKGVIEVETARSGWEGISVALSQDQSEEVKARLGDLLNNVMAAVILVLLVVLATLSARASMLVSMAIPGAFLTGVLALHVSGVTINFIVLFALIMSVGLLVDGSIVVVEYAERLLKSGVERKYAYAEASRRMAWPIIASTATTLAAFAPLMFWPDIVGEFMKFLPMTLLFVLSASLAMALFFVPVLGVYFDTLATYILSLALGGLGAWLVFSGVGSPYLSLLVFAVLFFGFRRYGAPRVLALLETRREGNSAPSIGGDVDLTNVLVDVDNVRGFTRFYVRVLRWSVARRRNSAIVLSGAVLALVTAFGMYGVFGKGIEFFPSSDPSQASLEVKLQGNYSASERDRLVREVEDIVLRVGNRYGEMKTIYTASGFVSGENISEDTIGRILLEFSDWRQRRRADAILTDLRQALSGFAGIVIEFEEDEDGPGGGPPVLVEIAGNELGVLQEVARAVRAEMESIEGLVDIRDTLPLPGIEWRLDVDRAQALRFGTDVQTVGQFIQLTTQGLKLSAFRPVGAQKEIDIVLRLPEEERSLSRLDDLRITTSNGEVPVSNFVTRRAQNPVGTIERVDEKRVIQVDADVEPGVLANNMLIAVQEKIDSTEFPPGISIRLRGESEDQENAQQFLMRAFGVALFVMALILLTQFNNFYQCLLILSAVVMSTIGVMIGLLIIGRPFGIVMSGIGVISLAGIVVNNNIVLIDSFNTVRGKYDDVRDAIIQAGAQRLRPVLLTAATTMLGLLPLVLESNVKLLGRVIEFGAPSAQWWLHLSSAIFFGMGFATILTLVVTPSLLLLGPNSGLARPQGRGLLWRLFSRRRARAPESAPI